MRLRASSTRDPDVLDTWFSSALWPYATLGWPEQTPELERYYPGDVNSTAREIIRLWENRMIWTGLELMGEIPFTDVIIHSTILAADGRRMSKSLGTGIDPLDLIATHGADATRYGLLKMSSTQDVRFAETLARRGPQAGEQALERLAAAAAGARRARRWSRRSLEERWILARLDAARAELEDAWRGSRSRPRRRRSTTSRSTTSATGTPRRSSRGWREAERCAATALAALEKLLHDSCTRSCRT